MSVCDLAGEIFTVPVPQTQTVHPEVEMWLPQASYTGNVGKGLYLQHLQTEHLDLNSPHVAAQWSSVSSPCTCSVYPVPCLGRSALCSMAENAQLQH